MKALRTSIGRTMGELAVSANSFLPPIAPQAARTVIERKNMICHMLMPATSSLIEAFGA